MERADNRAEVQAAARVNALLCASLDGPQALRWQAHELPPPAATELRVRVTAAGVNFGDVLLTRGKYQIRPPLPLVPGMEIAGEVLEAGAAVRGFARGDRVAAVMPEFGGFGECANVRAEHAFHNDARLPDEVAACIPSVYGTAWYALDTLAGLRAGELVLVLGAAGGIGSASVQLAKKLGATVIAAVGDAAKAEFARACGADQVIDCARAELRAALRELTATRGGVNLAIDPVGGSATEAALRNLAWGGRHLVVGFASGGIPAVAANLVLLKGAALLGVNFGGYALRFPDRAAAIYRTLVTMLAEDPGLRPPRLERVPMRDGAGALARMEARGVLGKSVLTNP
jgi:NADPH2:quinone reductase